MQKIISTLTMALLIAGVGFAQTEVKGDHGHQKPMKEFKGKKGDPIMQIESLSDTQRAELEKMKRQNRDATKPQREKIREMRHEIRTIETSENPDREQVNRLIDEKHVLEAQMEKDRASQRAKMRSVLSDDQKKELDVMMEKRKVERKEMKAVKKEKVRPQHEAH